jgi:hypothetical protein
VGGGWWVCGCGCVGVGVCVCGCVRVCWCVGVGVAVWLCGCVAVWDVVAHACSCCASDFSPSHPPRATALGAIAPRHDSSCCFFALMCALHPSRAAPPAPKVSVLEAVRVFDKPGVPFEDLVRGACAAGRSGISHLIHRHPVGVLMWRFRDQVCARMS